MKSIPHRFAWFVMAAGLFCRGSAFGQGTISATATLAETGSSGGEFDYTLTLDNTGNVPIDAFWYGWIPGAFDLPSSPSSITALSGWTGSAFGASIQFSDTSVSSSSSTAGANAIAPGGIAIFTFESTSDPAAMTTGTTGGAPTGDSIAYNAPGPMTDFEGPTPGVASAAFQPTLSSVPEPSTWSLLALGALGFWARARRLTTLKAL